MIAVVRQTQLLLGADVRAMVAAIARQVSEHVGPAWGLGRMPIEICDEGLAPADAWIVRLVDEGTPGDLGWHSEAGSLPYGEVAVAPILAAGGGALTGRGPESPAVSAVLSHEVIEMLCDPDAATWIDGPGGVQYALEACDPVEASGYQINGVDVSDFVPAPWFGLAPTLTLAGNVLGPFGLAPGGYAITRGPDGSITSLFGDRQPPAWRLGGPRAQRRRHAREAR